MPTRIGRPGTRNATWTPERVRERIKLTKLLERLQAFALGENDPQNGKPIVMSAEQVRAAVALIHKQLPDLKHIEHVGGLLLELELVSRR